MLFKTTFLVVKHFNVCQYCILNMSIKILVAKQNTKKYYLAKDITNGFNLLEPIELMSTAICTKDNLVK
jgi:hypothetical protein